MIHFPPKTVLVALDLSQESLVAWEHAKFLRRRLGCAIEAVYVDTVESIKSWDRKTLLDDLIHNMTAVEVLGRSTVPVLVMPQQRGRFLTARWADRLFAGAR